MQINSHFHKQFALSQCDILMNLLLPNLQSISIFFRETTLLLTNIVNTVEVNSKFGPLGAKMRKFHLFDVKIDTSDYLNQLKHLRRIVQKDFY